jgi:Na+-driven multidrug efflux pump
MGSALVTMVGTNVGAGRLARAERVAWVGAGLAAGITGTLGLLGAGFPRVWIGLFSSDSDVLAAGSRYLAIVGPTYGFFGLGLALYFASQGAGRLAWPLLAGAARLTIACGGGWLAVHWLGTGLSGVFGAMAAALVAFGGTLAIAVWRGVWRLPRGVANVPQMRGAPSLEPAESSASARAKISAGESTVPTLARGRESVPSLEAR